MSGILVSRFILNLRQVDQADGDDTEGKTSRFSLPAFRVASSALTGNLGEELEHAAFHTESAGESLGSSGVP